MTQRRVELRNGRVWTPTGFLEPATVVVEDERIVDVRPEEVRDGAGPDVEVVDARGLLVLPGVIDTHSHHRDPGFTHKEDITSATRAAAAGGITTSIGMPNINPPVTTPELYEQALAHYASRAIVDFNLHPAPTVPSALKRLSELGCLGFKLFMVVDTKRSYPHMPGLGVHHNGHLLEIFEAVAETDRPLMVHPHNQEIMEVVEKRFWDRGETSPLAYGQAQRIYDGLIWDTAIYTLLRLQEGVGNRLHVLHLVTTRSLDLVRAAKQAGRSVTAEVNPFALFLGDVERIERKGPYVMGRLISKEVQDALWAGLEDGTIDVIGTDHAPHTREEKEVGWQDMWKAPSGMPQLQDYFGKLLTEVQQGRLSLDAAVRATSYNPARVFGLYPKKGTIEVGSDADLVVVDLQRERLIRDEDALSKCGWSPYAGEVVRGVPVHTLVRGTFVLRDGTVVGQPGHGQVVKPLRD